MAAGSRAAKARYVSLTTSGAGESSPVLFGSNPLGDALLSTGLMTLAGPTAASMVPVLPVRMSGIEVRETLHRLDAEVHAPTEERGVTGANRVGEPLGAFTTRWLVAPDGFDATASAPPPHTELDLSRSQRFVMHDGVLRFQDRTQSGLRFFGAGRTYPTSAEGTTRLLFAGAAVVVEGLGGLKGLRGSLTVIGEISGRSLVSLVVAGRFDDDGPLEAVERLGLMIDSVGGRRDSTVLTLVGESDARTPGGQVDECIRAARIENDLANASWPRSAFRVGEAVGRATGPLRFDPSDRRCAVRLIDGRRELAFSDAAGLLVGTIVADALEGTAFRDSHAGDRASRVIAYGQLSAGTGALAGAGGLLAMDTAISPEGGAASLYTVWLVDERGRFRAPGQPAVPATSGASASTASAPQFQFVDRCVGSIVPADLEILAHAERTLVEGGEMRQWFQGKDRSADYGERFDLVRDEASHDESFGFFDVARIGGGQWPVMGIVQEMFYDRQKLGSAEPIRVQLEEFILHYFLRVCHGSESEAPPAGPPAPGSALLRAMSWLPDEPQRGTGIGYRQLYYRLAGAGRVGKFASNERTAIVDLREIGRTYDWILLKVDAPSVALPFAPFGSDAPSLQVPLAESTYLVMGPGFITRVDNPAPGVLAEYGFGCAFLPPTAGAPLLLGHGDGHLRTAIQTLNFKLMADGEIRARSVLVVARPDRIAAVDVDPIGWGVHVADLVTFRLASALLGPALAMTDRLPLRARDLDPIAAYIWMANTMTGGMAEKHLGISKAALERRMLLQHFRAQQEMLHRSLRVWRMVPDWTAHGELPEFCRRGEAC